MPSVISDEFQELDEPDDEPVRAEILRQRFGSTGRQAALDPDDGMEL